MGREVGSKKDEMSGNEWELPEIEKQLALALDLTADPGELVEAFITRLVKAGGNCSAEEWDTLAPEVQEWVNVNVERLNQKQPVVLSGGRVASVVRKGKGRGTDDQSAEPSSSEKPETADTTSPKKTLGSKRSKATKATPKPATKATPKPATKATPKPATKATPKSLSTIALLRRLLVKRPNYTNAQLDKELTKDGGHSLNASTYAIQRRLVRIVKSASAGEPIKTDMSTTEKVIRVLVKHPDADQSHKDLVGLTFSPATLRGFRSAVVIIKALL